jgi:hypothetical protein
MGNRSMNVILADPDSPFQTCHPERGRGSGATEGESKDPENVSFTMLMQGISTMNADVLRLENIAENCCNEFFKIAR